MAPTDSDVTLLLDAARAGDDAAAERLARVVYDSLHDIAERALRREAAGHTLQATELVGEAFLRLVGPRDTPYADRAHFYAVASGVIRHILVDHARRRRRVKRDHGVRVPLEAITPATADEPLDVIALDDALRELERLSPRQGRVVELRYFAGLEIDEIARLLDISPATVKRDWTFARAFLLKALATDA